MATVAKERTWLEQEEGQKMKQCWTTATPTHSSRERCRRRRKEEGELENQVSSHVLRATAKDNKGNLCLLLDPNQWSAIVFQDTAVERCS